MTAVARLVAILIVNYAAVQYGEGMHRLFTFLPVWLCAVAAALAIVSSSVVLHDWLIDLLDREGREG